VQSGSISVTTQSVEYSLDGTTYQASNTFSGLTRMIILYMFRAPVIILVTDNVVIGDNNKCCAAFLQHKHIQPTCGTPSGTIVVSTQTGVEYSLNGTTYQSSNTFSGLAPNDYTLYVRNSMMLHV
jgi:hypothetical protein